MDHITRRFLEVPTSLAMLELLTMLTIQTQHTQRLMIRAMASPATSPPIHTKYSTTSTAANGMVNKELTNLHCQVVPKIS